MPDAGWAVSRHRPTLPRGTEVRVPVSTSVEYVTTRHQRFTRVRLLKTHLTEWLPPFPATLTTKALYPRSLWRFEACPCRPASGGRPPSPVKLHVVSNRDDMFTAHDLLILDRLPEPLDEDVVAPCAFAVHADGYAVFREHLAKG